MKKILTVFNKSSLPSTLHAGDSLEAQLSPLGEFPGFLGNERILQKCTREAFEQVVASFKDEVLVDFEHKAETGGDTLAAAWIQSLRLDPELGLMGTFLFTEAGAEAVSSREIRFLSPVWEIDDTGHPVHLVSVGLTNKPNLPVAPILNRAPGAFNEIEGKGQRMKEELIQALGLAPEAEEAAIIEAVKALVDEVGALNAEALNAEAEACADENKDRIENRAAFVSLYCKNKEMAKAMLNCMKPAQVVHAPANAAPVCNSKNAMLPSFDTEIVAARTALNTWRSMPNGDAKTAYLMQNKAAIQAAVNEGNK